MQTLKEGLECEVVDAEVLRMARQIEWEREQVRGWRIFGRCVLCGAEKPCPEHGGEEVTGREAWEGE